jgi:hypothetical protein
VPALRHSEREQREIIVGHSTADRLLLVCFTERRQRVIRIFSARPATKKERQTMKRASSDEPADDLLPEYELDYRKARPNRFVLQPEDRGRTVVLEPDIAQVFKTSDSVNSVLRALIQTMPH